VHDGDASNLASVKRQGQWASDADWGLACEIATLYASAGMGGGKTGAGPRAISG
jgi:hypothetical protein